MAPILVSQGEVYPTVDDVVEECRQDYGEAGGSKLSRPSWVRWINRTISDLATTCFCYEPPKTTIDAVAGVGVYAMPARWFAISELRYENRLLIPIDERQAVRLYGYNWRTITGAPVYWMTAKPRRFVLVPIPEAALADAMELTGFAVPQAVTAEVESGTQTIELPATFVPAIVAGACAKASIRDKDVKLRAYFREEYEREVGKRVAEMGAATSGRVEFFGADGLLPMTEGPDVRLAERGEVI